MPTLSLQDRVAGHDRVFDARPDRIDYRDRPYQPPLVSLPEEFPHAEFVRKHLPFYTEHLILDQGEEGACTGFGLAAVVNYLLWKNTLAPPGNVPLADSEFELRVTALWKRDSPTGLERVSARMLYHMAQLYDEWDGEDYEGSSCRGAMKGWHRHGVCLERFWKSKLPRRVRKPQGGARGKRRANQPEATWQEDAARRPLGAYYRVNKNSINDMQAAVCEVGAVYASAEVHKGWFVDPCDELPIIAMKPDMTGGHAFAIVGYTPDGFIVQNSWGPDWGFHGFAILSYADWVQHGSDAWVAVLGAPMALPREAVQVRTHRSANLRDVADGKAEWHWRADSTKRPYTYKKREAEPWSESRAYEHTVVLENNGRPVNRFLDLADAAAAVKEVVLKLPLQFLQSRPAPKIAIYAHGGLNDEDASIRRVRVLAPYFLTNEIYPLFITWRTGFLESIEGMMQDEVERFFTPAGEPPARGWFDTIKDQLQEARDRAVEVAAENLLVKAVWTQMKQNAEAATQSGLALVTRHLQALAAELPKLEVHLVGHSAGSLILGHLLDLFVRRGQKAATMTLFAPACTVGFAREHYVPAVQARTLAKDTMHFDILSDERELADSVGPYGKSLLYLVSRALEIVHKTPLLGMDLAWNPDPRRPDVWTDAKRHVEDLAAWRAFANDTVVPRVHDKRREMVSDGQGDIPLAHGSFDNDVDVMTKTLQRMRGSSLKVPVENLRGF